MSEEVSVSPILEDSQDEKDPIQLAANEFTFREEEAFPILPVALVALILLALLGLVVIRISGK